MKAKVYITLKKSVMDPQGAAVIHSLEAMNYSGVQDVRIGKMIEVGFDDKLDKAKAEKQLTDMCDKLLANPVIEDYRFEFI
ncbi:MAG: phosphoribosylformylglycinamidine synthase subunit PurS [Candidatus Omnitrophica bacterium]|nr:phosphoribosylformylglycinamidine synthase subunit PurS [Candidatus Omnitrophota bacterium]